MKEIEKTNEEKTKTVTPATTPIVNINKQPGQQQEQQKSTESPTAQTKKITDTPDTDVENEQPVKGETTEEETAAPTTAVETASEEEESEAKS